MAITLDELLGRNRTEEQRNFDAFPPMEEYTARRASGSTYTAPERPQFDIERRPYTPPRTVEEVREYASSSPYMAPRREEYREPERAEEYTSRYAYRPEPRQAPARPEERRSEGGFYEFAATDTERASGQDLYDRLSANTRVSEQETAARRSYGSDYAERYRTENVPKRKRARLGLKAKLIIAAYAVVFAVISILIIVNAGALNRGSAAVPAGNGAAVADAFVAAHTADAGEIEYGYDAEMFKLP